MFCNFIKRGGMAVMSNHEGTKMRFPLPAHLIKRGKGTKKAKVIKGPDNGADDSKSGKIGDVKK